MEGETDIKPRAIPNRGRPRRAVPGERIHVVLGEDIMALLRKEMELNGGSYSKFIENRLIEYFKARNQQQSGQEIV